MIPLFFAAGLPGPTYGMKLVPFVELNGWCPCGQLIPLKKATIGAAKKREKKLKVNAGLSGMVSGTGLEPCTSSSNPSKKSAIGSHL
jgi:hypothetical protein